MNLTVRKCTEDDAAAICGWRYDPPYDIYNLPDWGTAKQRNYAITDSGRRENEFFAVIAVSDVQPSGYFRLVNKNEFVMLGLGLRPDLCGMGLGREIVALALSASEKLHGRIPVRLEVREFNIRAVKCYQSAGFVTKETCIMSTPSGTDRFIRMEYRFQ